MPTAASVSSPGLRRLAAGIAGFCTFLNLYAPQALLPMLSTEFGAGPADISHIMTATTLAVAVTGPFTGAIADVLGRKRVIVAAMLLLVVPTVLMGLAPSLDALVLMRFVQGLMLPPVFAVMVAYISEEWPPHEAVGATGVYISGSSFGGFAGRLVAGIAADLAGWRWAFVALALISLAGALAVIAWLPRERAFVRSAGLLASSRQMLRHLGNPHLLATFAVGFGVLFNFLATFTYISFHLAAPPYALSASALGTVFAVYLVGSVLTPWVGWGIARAGGRRPLAIGIIALWVAGVGLTLAASLTTIVLGLAICAGCGMLCQAISTGYVAATAVTGRSSAVGLYVTCYYAGGSCGAVLGGIAWTLGAWQACAALVAAMLTLMALIVTFAWSEPATGASLGDQGAPAS